jgi:hypothetical protein
MTRAEVVARTAQSGQLTAANAGLLKQFVSSKRDGQADILKEVRFVCPHHPSLSAIHA